MRQTLSEAPGTHFALDGWCLSLQVGAVHGVSRSKVPGRPTRPVLESISEELREFVQDRELWQQAMFTEMSDGSEWVALSPSQLQLGERGPIGIVAQMRRTL